MTRRVSLILQLVEVVRQLDREGDRAHGQQFHWNLAEEILDLIRRRLAR